MAQWRRVSITMWCMAVGVTLLMGAVFVRVAQLQIAPGERLAQHIQDRKSSRAQIAPRGDIVDRRGRVLSATRTGYRLFVDPSALTAPYGELFTRLAEISDLDEGEIADRIIPKIAENEVRKEKGLAPIQYVSIGGVLPDWRLEAARKFKAPGVHLEMRSVREITGGDGVASLVGKVGVDHMGLIGAEQAFDALVQPKPGRLDYVRDASGRAMWVEAAGYRPASAGQSVWLSIDLAIQEIAEEEIERGVMEADAVGGRIIVADPMTGEILAMHDFVRDMSGLVDPPARRPKGSPRQALELPAGARYRTIRPDPRRAIHPALGRNRCVEDVYEPGSTFKPYLWASVTERGYAKPDEVFNTHDGVWVNAYGRTLRDVIPKPSLTWADVLVYSSNIGMTQGVDRMPFNQTRADILRFGFGSKTNIGLPGESGGLVTSPRNWTKYTQTSVASGYEVAVTPLQMVRAFSVFCRSGDLAGTLPNLRLRAVTKQELAAEQPRRVIPAWLAHQVRGIMLKVGEIMDTRMRDVHKDEAPLLYSVFGKSGTAEIPRPDGRGYFKNQHNSSFIAGAPVETPRIVVLVVIDDPGPALVARRQHFGSWVAGPVVRRVTQRTLEYLGVPPTAPEPALASAEADEPSAAHN
jgi:cell division protein FtsI/penicillin-binding protein 2